MNIGTIGERLTCPLDHATAYINAVDFSEHLSQGSGHTPGAATDLQDAHFC